MKLTATKRIPLVVTLTYYPFFQVHLVNVSALFCIVVYSNVELLRFSIWERTDLIQLNHLVVEIELGLAIRIDLDLSIFVFFIGILLDNKQVVVLVLICWLLVDVPFEYLAQVTLPLRPALV